VCLAVGGVAAWAVRAVSNALRRLAGELGDGAEQVASAALQVSSSSQSLAQGSSEQAASLEETSASTEEINSMARKNSERFGGQGAECAVGDVERHRGAADDHGGRRGSARRYPPKPSSTNRGHRESSAPGERSRRGALGFARGCVAPTKILGPRSAGSCGPRREQGSPST